MDGKQDFLIIKRWGFSSFSMFVNMENWRKTKPLNETDIAVASAGPLETE